MGTGIITENGIEKKSFFDFSRSMIATAEIPEVVRELQNLKENIVK
jgi:hypothetical protein